MREKDGLNRFVIETTDVRGLIVHLDDTWAEALARTEYPPDVQDLLGQAFAASVLLSATIKFDGKMTVQIRGNGPVHLLVVQVTADRKVRGLARWSELPGDKSLRDLFGVDARMTITIEASRHTEPYQGIVALEGETLTDALRDYFKNSEQLETELILAVGDHSAAGMLLQKLAGASVDSDGWNRSVHLASTLEPDELLNLDASDILHRLFHEEQVRLFDTSSVMFECSCSKIRTDGLILGLGIAEAESIIAEQGAIDITCEFCDAEYRYDSVDVAVLFADSTNLDSEDNQTLH